MRSSQKPSEPRSREPAQRYSILTGTLYKDQRIAENTRVIGMKIDPVHPELSGFDYHYLFPRS